MAIDFSGSSGEFARVEAAPVTATPLSMVCLMNSDVNNASDTLFCLTDASAPNDRWQLTTSGQGGGANGVGFAATGNSFFEEAESTTDFTANTWHSAVGQDPGGGGTRSVFLDGGSEGTVTNTQSPANVDRMAIGRVDDSTPGNEFNGSLAEVALYNVTLTGPEATSLGLRFSPQLVRPSALRAHWPLVRDFRDVVLGNTFIDQGTSSVVDHPRVFNKAPVLGPVGVAAVVSGRIMGGLAGQGGLAGAGGLAGQSGGIVG